MKRLMSMVLVLAAGAVAAEERTTLPVLDAPTLTAACKQAILEAKEAAKGLAAPTPTRMASSAAPTITGRSPTMAARISGVSTAAADVPRMSWPVRRAVLVFPVEPIRLA